MCDPLPRFLAKGQVGANFRAVARNGRVLLASNHCLKELDGTLAQVRLQTWHKAILPGEPPQPFGILVCVRVLDEESGNSEYDTRIVSSPDSSCELALDVGGMRWLEFRRLGA
jgi:hypothetical protein